MLIILALLLLFNSVLTLSIKKNPVQEATSKIISIPQENLEITEESKQKIELISKESPVLPKKGAKQTKTSFVSSAPRDNSEDYTSIEQLETSYTQLTTTIDPYIYLDSNYQHIAIASNPHPEDGPIQGATEINNGEDFAFVWQNGKVRFYHESELDKVRGNWNFSAGAEMINHYKEFQTMAYPATGIVEVPPGLWPGEYKYEICTGEPTCEQAIGYTWGDIVISDVDDLWFYTKDGEFKSRMAVFTNDMRDIAYDKEFNRFFATTTDYLRVLVRNDKWLVFNAVRYCKPGSPTVCEGDPMGKPYALKILDMENSPLTQNMIISGYQAKRMELDGNYISGVDSITTNLASQTSYISGMAYTNHYSVETVYSPSYRGFYLYYGGYDNGPQNPSQVTRFTAHLEKNAYPYVKSLSPENNYIETSDKTTTFAYIVNYSTQMDSCNLTINNNTVLTNNNVSSGIEQQFVYELENGEYNWSIQCIAAEKLGITETRNLIVNIPPEEICNGIDDDGDGLIDEDNVCIPRINSCTTITNPGEYWLNNNLINFPDTGNKGCINIQSANVTFDCKDYSIINPTLFIAGVYSNKPYTTIRNCNIQMSPYLSSPIWKGGTGIYLDKTNNSYVYNNILNNQGYGIYASEITNSKIENNTANNNNGEAGIYISGNNNNIIGNKASNNNQAGIKLASNFNSNLIDNIANYNRWGLYLIYSENNLIQGNTANNNKDDGIYYYSDNNELSDNTACNNGDGTYYNTPERYGREYDFRCYLERWTAHGTGNKFNSVLKCGNEWPIISLDYEIC